MSVDDALLGPTADQARRRLVAMIKTGALAPGERLGAERDLAVQLEVSRSTLRQALAALETDGLVRRVSGRSGGTFVAREKIERDLSRIVGVPALLRGQGYTAGSRIVSLAVVPADPEAAAALQLDTDSLVFDLVRIRLADGMPISLEHARFPAERFPGLPEQPLSGSLYELLESEYGVGPHEALEQLEVVSAGDDEARVLGLAKGSPLISITRTTTDSDGVPFEYSNDLFRADRTRITVRTHGVPASDGTPRVPGRVVELRGRS
ncbi:MAG: GntR family transcriptional regulator [Actinomycetes bacterium]